MKRLLLLGVLIILIGGGIFYVMSQQPEENPPATATNAPYDPKVGIQDNVYFLSGDRSFIKDAPAVGSRGSHSYVAVVILPENTRADDVKAAWSYAVRYSADGLDKPNYYKAVELLMERHPTWIAAVTKGYSISFDSNSADKDIPD